MTEPPVLLRTTERRARVLLARALRLRCPNCGRDRMFETWFRMRERCRTCGLVYERGEHDYFIGAYLLNLIVAELNIAGLLLVLVLATWPAVPWRLLMWVIGLLTIPGIFVTYPFSRSLWLALDLVFRPAEAADFAPRPVLPRGAVHNEDAGDPGYERDPNAEAKPMTTPESRRTATPKAKLPDDVVGALRAIVDRTRKEGEGEGEGEANAVLLAGGTADARTAAAELLAADLRRPLQRIDLAAVASEYIGETEKNLDAVFRDAEASNAILFFDEADALFGRRTEVKDAHDRYANIETSYLLQRLEQYDGLAILATNRRDNTDSRIARRLRRVIAYTLPDPD